MQAKKIDNSELLKAASQVPCIRVVAQPAPDKSRRIAGPFYPDQIERLTELLQSLTRREPFMVALDGDGLVNLYRTPKAK